MRTTLRYDVWLWICDQDAPVSKAEVIEAFPRANPETVRVAVRDLTTAGYLRAEGFTHARRYRPGKGRPAVDMRGRKPGSVAARLTAAARRRKPSARRPSAVALWNVW